MRAELGGFIRLGRRPAGRRCRGAYSCLPTCHCESTPPPPAGAEGAVSAARLAQPREGVPRVYAHLAQVGEHTLAESSPLADRGYAYSDEARGEAANVLVKAHATPDP